MFRSVRLNYSLYTAVREYLERTDSELEYRAPTNVYQF